MIDTSTKVNAAYHRGICSVPGRTKSTRNTSIVVYYNRGTGSPLTRDGRNKPGSVAQPRSSPPRSTSRPVPHRGPRAGLVSALLLGITASGPGKPGAVIRGCW